MEWSRAITLVTGAVRVAGAFLDFRRDGVASDLEGKRSLQRWWCIDGSRDATTDGGGLKPIEITRAKLTQKNLRVSKARV